MNKYIEQLIEQFEESKNRIICKSKAMEIIKGKDPNDVDFEDVERYLNDDGIPMSEIFDIEKACLPDDSLVDDKLIEILAQECEDLWNCYNFYADFPDNVPPRIRYRKLREKWDEPSVYMSSGQAHIEFCSYDQEDCPFPEYCKKCSEFDEKYWSDNYSGLPDNSINDFIEEQGILTDRSGKVKDLKDKIRNFDHSLCISGIHNYCDRWCERCHFTEKCAVFIFEKDMKIERKLSDENDFLDYLSLLFEATGDMIREQITENDVDFQDTLLSIPDNLGHDHPLVILSAGYAEKVSNWYKSGCFDKPLKQKENDMPCEATDVILWYHIFISAKLYRACLDRGEGVENIDGQDDSNGSAKIAMIAIKRSIAAWGLLLEKHLNHEDEIYSFLKILGELLGKAKTAFPYAESFIRPGLDEQK